MSPLPLMALSVCSVTAVPVFSDASIVAALMVPPLDDTLMSVGSSSQNPPFPADAPASTRPRTCSDSLPEVSTKPPLPPAAPPRAEMAPSKRVPPSAHTTTLPPWPLSVASAAMVAACATTVSADGGTGLRAGRMP